MCGAAKKFSHKLEFGAAAAVQIPVNTFLITKLIPSISLLQISDIHQFYTRSYEISMEDLEFVMSSISFAASTCSMHQLLLLLPYFMLIILII